MKINEIEKIMNNLERETIEVINERKGLIIEKEIIINMIKIYNEELIKRIIHKEIINIINNINS